MSTQQTFLDLLARLVAIPSIEGATKEKNEIIALAKQWLTKCGIAVTDYPHAESPSIVADLPGTGKPILLLAHLDVVPADSHMFSLYRDGDILKGRGVLDDKGPAALLMLLLSQLKKKGGAHRALRLCLTSDEEVGSLNGVQRLVHMNIFNDVGAVLALDGGGSTEVIFREKGVIHLTLDAVGTSAHNSMPWLGDNAIEKIWRVYERLKNALPPTENTDHWHPTVSIGMIHGGEFVNQLPAHATAKIDVRFTADHNEASIETLVASCLENGVTAKKTSSGPSFETDINHPLLQQYRRVMTDILGQPVNIGSEHGATDARFFTHLNVPILIHDPDGGGMHTDEEWVSLAAAIKLLDGLEHFAREIA